MARKAPTAAQKKARAAFAAKYGGKSRSAATAADNPRKRRRRRRANPKAAAPAAANPKRRRRRRRANPAVAAAPAAANPRRRRRRRSNPVRAAAPAANPRRRRRRRRSNPARAAAPASNPRRRRRRRAANPRVARYTRKKTVRGHYRKPAKKSRRRRDNPASAGRGITVHTHMHGGSPVRDNPKRRRRSRRRSNPAGQYQYAPAMRQGMLDNPSYSPLFENPMGAYSMDSLKAFGIASAGVGLGLLVARGIDRFVATMKPAKSKSGVEAQRGWYGKNAVAAINRRPGLVRLGVQAGGAVVGIGAAYALRNKPIAPWLLGGIALGFGSNMLLQVFEWYVIPRLLKVKDANEQTLANQLYVLEQVDTQDKVDAILEDWSTKPALMANQEQAEASIVIMGPLNDASSPDVATLGRGAAGSRPSGPAMVGQARRFVPDGRVGNCDECGGQGGHYAGCDKCATCNGGGDCAYTVMPGDDLAPVLAESGTDINVIAGLNGGGSPESWWLAGNRVILPNAACHAVTRGAAQRRPAAVSGVPESAVSAVSAVETPPPPAATPPSMPARSPVPASVAFALAGAADE